MSGVTKLKVGGKEIEVYDTAQDVDFGPPIMYRKEDRASMDEYHRRKMKETFMAYNERYQFSTPAQVFNDLESLDKIQDLQSHVDKQTKWLYKYDTHNVFTVFKSKSDDTIEEEVNLLSDWKKVTVAEVAKSNEWYRRRAKAEWYRDNLHMTHNCIQNNMDDELFSLCKGQLSDYDQVQYGGPLLFKIMIDKLSIMNYETANHYKTAIKNLSPLKYDGENISKMMANIRAAYEFIQGVESCKYGKNELEIQIIEIMTKATVEEFRGDFILLRGEARNKDEEEYKSVAELLALAERKYTTLTTASKWQGIKTIGESNAAGFQAKANGNKTNDDTTCFNCGKSGHHVKDCTSPKDRTAITQRYNEFYKNRKKQRESRNKKGRGKDSDGDKDKSSRGSKGKYAPPSKTKNNKRTIDGKPMWWNKFKNHWVDDKFPPQQAQTAGAIMNAPTQGQQGQVQAQSAPPIMQQGQVAIESKQAAIAAIATYKKSLDEAADRLMAQFE